VLIVNYWATWCQPCREEMPGFSRLQDKYRDKGVQFVGISSDTADKIIEFQKTTPVNYPLLIGDIGIMESSAKLGNTRQGCLSPPCSTAKALSATKLGSQLKELISR
jgi:thiol-disulfide isomerase/thioredoxin